MDDAKNGLRKTAVFEMRVDRPGFEIVLRHKENTVTLPGDVRVVSGDVLIVREYMPAAPHRSSLPRVPGRHKYIGDTPPGIPGIEPNYSGRISVRRIQKVTAYGDDCIAVVIGPAYHSTISQIARDGFAMRVFKFIRRAWN